MTTTEVPARATPRDARSRGVRLRRRAVRVSQFTALLGFVVFFVIPIYVLLVTSFKPFDEVDPSRAWKLPENVSFQAWAVAFEQLSPALVNSLRLVVPGALISAVLGSMNGFVLSRWRFPGSDVVFTVLLFGMFIPYQAVMIPLVQLMTNVGLQGSILGLMLVHVVYGIPICTLIFRNYYAATMPPELMEAALVDGAGMLRTFRSVVLPNSAPGFVVTLIWQFTSIWNDFLFAIFLTSPENWPVTVQLNNIAGSMVVPFNQQMAAALLASIPTLIIYILLGRYFMRGLMAGALKG